MKKKRDWATIAGVAAGTLAYLKFAKVAAEPEEKKPEETPKEACVRWYGNLTWQQYQDKILNLDIDFEEGRIDKAVYDAKHFRLVYCRNQQKVPGF
jgi:hypothetical protein